MTRHHVNILIFILNCTWIGFFFHDSSYMWLLMGLAALLFLSVLSLGILLPNQNYFIKSITNLKSGKVLLTFDDGPDKDVTAKILALLEKHQIGALFFVVGAKSKKHPNLLQKTIDAGHLIGNHTQTHPLMFAMKNEQSVQEEIALCDNTLIEMKIHPGNYFRPPVGYTNPRIARATKKYKKQMIGWSLRSYDSVLTDESKLLQRIVSRVKSNDIVLFHDNLPQTAAVLDDFILQAKQNGINFVTKEDLKNIFQ